jgi:hypothetical protein
MYCEPSRLSSVDKGKLRVDEVDLGMDADRFAGMESGTQGTRKMLNQ